MNNKLLKLFYITFIVICCFLGVAKFNCVAENILINNESVTPFNEGWIYSINGEEQQGAVLTLPAKIENIKSDDVITIKNTLPPQYKEGMTICFRSVQQFVKIYVNGEQIYSYGYDSTRPFGKSPGSAWNFIRLDKSTQGGEIVIEVSSPYDAYSNNINNINYGSKNSNVFHIVIPNSFALLMSILIIAFGCAILLIFFFFIKQENSEVILLFGIFALIGGIWSLAETRLMQLFTSNQYFISLMSFCALMLLPIPLLLFISKTHNFRNKKIFDVLVGMCITSTFVVIGLQLLNVYDLIETSFIFIGMLILSMAVVAIKILIEIFIYKNKEIVFIGTGTCILLFLASFDYMNFFGRFTGDNSFFFRFGMLIYIGILASLATRQIINMKTENLKMDVLEDLAYADLLTNLKNRAAFETEMEIYRKDMTLCNKLCIGIFDINNLKTVNDTKGHKAGDDMLIHASECLKTVFKNNEKVYRIGGDEFAVILNNTDIPSIEEHKAKFKEVIEKLRIEKDYRLEIAYGFALFDEEIDSNVDELYVRADAIMYALKSEMKSKLGRRSSDRT